MKPNTLCAALGLVVTLATSTAAQAQIQFNLQSQNFRPRTEYFCETEPSGEPVTRVKLTTPSGTITEANLIRWGIPFSDEWTPARRCDVVAERFQRLSDQGRLRYLTTGTLNQETVICAPYQAQGEGCTGDNLLLTIRREDAGKAELILANLLEISVDPSRPAIVQGSESLDRPSCVGGTQKDWSNQPMVLCFESALNRLAQESEADATIPAATIPTLDVPPNPPETCERYNLLTGDCLSPS